MTRSLLALCAAAAALALTHADASPLDADACGKLKTERSGLEQAGIRASMGKGPEWAKANLAADKLQLIRRLIELDGQLLFRCSGQTLVELPASVEADPAATTPPEDAEGKDGAKTPKADAGPVTDKKAKTPAAKPAPDSKTPAVKAEKSKTDDKAKPADKKADDKSKQDSPAAAKAAAVKPAPPKKPADKAPDDGAQQPAKAAAKPKPKPKTDDAYKAPPPADPNANPFPKLAP